ncbi:MAG: ribonuclease HII [Candidatus Caenarcaniphilales bacterium]|nr:ribonuclease HII [Candidatus Caenarcaniphilales bacterium]
MLTLKSLLEYDTNLFSEGNYDILVGLDEVGRGCLAGPVAVAAYSSMTFCDSKLTKSLNEKKLQFLTKRRSLESINSLKELNDSKKVKASSRQLLVDTLKDDIKSSYYAIGEKSSVYIDEHGIVISIFEAMKEALVKVLDSYNNEHKQKIKSILVLVDGLKVIPKLEEFLELAGFDIKVTQKAIRKGDAHSASIAAASNIAKDYRDKLMRKLVADNPELNIYSWKTNVGYGSKKHRDAISEHGLSEYHRRSFCRSYQL